MAPRSWLQLRRFRVHACNYVFRLKQTSKRGVHNRVLAYAGSIVHFSDCWRIRGTQAHSPRPVCEQTGGGDLAAIGAMGGGCRPPSDEAVSCLVLSPAPRAHAQTSAHKGHSPCPPFSPWSGVPRLAGAVHRAQVGVSRVLSILCTMLRRATRQEMAWDPPFPFPLPPPMHRHTAPAPRCRRASDRARLSSRRRAISTGSCPPASPSSRPSSSEIEAGKQS